MAITMAVEPPAAVRLQLADPRSSGIALPPQCRPTEGFQLTSNMWSIMTSIYREALSSLLLRVVLGLLLLWLVQWVWSRRRLYALSWRIPGPFALPFLGNAVQLGALSSHQDMINCLARMKDRYGGFWRIWMGPSLCIVVTEPDDFESVMLSRATSIKGAPYEVIKTGMGAGLVTLSGEKWKHHRNLINPVFSNKRMKEYQHIHNKNSRHLVDGLLEVCNKGYHDVSVFAMRFSADETCHGLFEWETNFYQGKNDHILSMTRWSAQLLHERICKVWLTPDITYKYTQHSQIFQHYLKQYKEFYYDTLKERVRKINSLKSDPCEKTDMKKQLHDEPTYDFDDGLFEDKGEKMTMMTVLSEAVRRGEMTEDEMCDEFNNFISPGIDTGFTQLSSFLLLMAMHPDHQERAWKEIKELFKDDLDADVKVEHFTQLPFLDLCMKETMRLFATGPVQIRYLPKDFYMKSRNMTIPAGTSIMMCNFLMHTDPRYWKDPNLFIPERFADKSTKRPHFSFVPFSGGQRNCIGQTYGYDSWKTAAIHIIRNYVLYTDLRMEKLTYKATISVRSGVGYNLKFFKRNRNL